MVMVNLCINWCWWGNANCTWCLLWNWNSSQYPSLPLTSNNGWIKCSGWCIMKWKLSQMIESLWSVQWKIENLKNLIQLLSVPVICDILGISEGCTVDVLGMSYHIMPYHQQYILHICLGSKADVKNTSTWLSFPFQKLNLNSLLFSLIFVQICPYSQVDRFHL